MQLGCAIHFQLRWVMEDDGMNKQELGMVYRLELVTLPPAIA